MDTIRLDYFPQVRTLTVELSDTLVAGLQELAKSCAEIDADWGGATTHGGPSVGSVLAMPAEDADMVLTRPGFWEGTNLVSVRVSRVPFSI
jgi:hypothetical protein